MHVAPLTDGTDLDPFLFWAKWARSRSPQTFHPLLCHMLDVAVVARAMWNAVVGPAARRGLSRALGVDEGACGGWLAFFAGLHDLGKASPAFQCKIPLARDRLSAAGFPCPLLRSVAPHGTVSAAVLPALLIEQFRLEPTVAHSVALLVGGHHGSFPSSQALEQLDPAAIGKGRWRPARLVLAQQLAVALDLPVHCRPRHLDNSTAMVLAGLISVADWIGSNEQFFRHQAQDAEAVPVVDMVQYGVVAAACARIALDTLGWTGWVPAEAPRSFRSLFPAITEVRPVQSAVETLTAQFSGPGLVVIEAPMGEGKTEAALYLADYWGALLGQRGMYLALPTMATSNQMFTRVAAFLAGRYPAGRVNLQLLHGHAALSAEFEELRRNGLRIFDLQDVSGPAGSDGAPASVVAAEWFTARKRGLLAPFGVGTVDQALLTVLQVRHGFVRLYGLSGKTVVIDEVHAYDTYMTTLLERLLAWLGALGTPVVLLSATLPRARAEQLLRAYADGAGWELPALPASTRYPRLAWTTAGGSGTQGITASPLATRRLRVAWINGALPGGDGAPFPLGERLAAALAGGGCAAVICNTVRRAQQVYRALTPLFPGLADDGAPELDLLHARYLFKDRERRERRVLGRFGKEAGSRRPRRAVLVATQLIEQSLDLDFDLMISEPAPADLILQRSGRLHRHHRPGARPPGLDQPRLWLWAPTSSEGVPQFGRATEYIYDHHVLLRSWLALRDRVEIAIPADVEDLVEAVYDERPCPPDLAPPLRAVWEQTRRAHLDQLQADAHEAATRYIKRPWYDGTLADLMGDPREEDAPELHPAHQALTRLAEPTVPVVFLYGTPERPTFDRAGSDVLPVGATPDAATTRRLLRQAVGVGDRRIVFHLLNEPVPRGWPRSPLLRHHRLLLLGADGGTVYAGARLWIDNELGLVVTTHDATGGEDA